MADGTATITIDTNEWVYPDENGVEHTVTNGQTFDLASVDGGDSAVLTPSIDQTVTTTDGYVLTFRTSESLKLAGNAAVTDDNYTLGGLVIHCSATDQDTTWKCTGFDADDADALASITAASFEAEDNPMRTFTWSGVDSSFA